MSVSSAELASHGDILTKILLRLPIRSLIRFKCVCKHWQNLISSRRFALIRNPNPNPPSGLFLHQRSKVCAYDYDFVPFDLEKPVKPPFKVLDFNIDISHYGIMVLQSLGGLMLCEVLSLSSSDRYYVYNPTNNHRTVLPAFDDSDCFEMRASGMTLASDPLVSPHYKVICVRRYLPSNGSDKYRIEVYSSENKRWKVSSTPITIPKHTALMSGVYWNNTIHWINSEAFVWYLKIKDDELIQQCETKRIPTPCVRQHIYNKWDLKAQCPPLVKSRDSLLFINVFPSSYSNNVDVHEMITDYSG